MALMCAYAAMGKTTLASKYANVEDPETLMFQWIYDDEHKNLPYEELKGRNDIRRPNPNFPHNYIEEYISKYVATTDEVLFMLPPVRVLLEELKSQGYSWIATYPDKNILHEYKNRFISRNNGPEFINALINNFDEYVDMISLNPNQIIVAKNEHDNLETLILDNNLFKLKKA